MCRQLLERHSAKQCEVGGRLSMPTTPKTWPYLHPPLLSPPHTHTQPLPPSATCIEFVIYARSQQNIE